MANSSIESCGHSQPFAYLLLPFNVQPSTRGHLKAYEISHGKSRPITFWHWHGESVNSYSYPLRVKSVVCHCVRGSRLLSNLVIYVHTENQRDRDDPQYQYLLYQLINNTNR